MHEQCVALRRQRESRLRQLRWVGVAVLIVVLAFVYPRLQGRRAEQRTLEVLNAGTIAFLQGQEVYRRHMDYLGKVSPDRFENFTKSDMSFIEAMRTPAGRWEMVNLAMSESTIHSINHNEIKEFEQYMGDPNGEYAPENFFRFLEDVKGYSREDVDAWRTMYRLYHQYDNPADFRDQWLSATREYRSKFDY